jgi:hypothetical protein
MQNLPEVGKTYISEIDPTFRIFVTEVTPPELDPLDKVMSGFFVECCPPGEQDDMQAMGYEFMQDEWEAHRFIPLA